MNRKRTQHSVQKNSAEKNSSLKKSGEQAQQVYGINAVEATLTMAAENIDKLLIQKGLQSPTIQRVWSLAKTQGLAVQIASKKELDKLTGQGNHQGVLVYREKVVAYTLEDLEQRLSQMEKPPLLLVLDQVQDPRNLGACLRTADAVGVTAVIVPDKNSAGLTDAAYKTASGAAETVPLIRVTNLARTLRRLKALGIWLIGTDQDGEQRYNEADFRGAVALIMGNEGQGLRRLSKEHCDFLVNIPMAGAVSSLNISVATGVCLYEAVRQRG